MYNQWIYESQYEEGMELGRSTVPFGDALASIFAVIGIAVCAWYFYKHVLLPFWNTENKLALFLLKPVLSLLKPVVYVGTVLVGVVFVGWFTFLLPTTFIMGILCLMGMEPQMALVFAIVIVGAFWLRKLNERK